MAAGAGEGSDWKVKEWRERHEQNILRCLLRRVILYSPDAPITHRRCPGKVQRHFDQGAFAKFVHHPVGDEQVQFI